MTSLASELRESELRALVAVIEQMGGCEHFLEVGTAAGGTLVSVLETMRSKGALADMKVSVVDTFKYFKDQKSVWEENLKKHEIATDAIQVYEVNSMQAWRAANAAQETYAVILIDAGHKLKDVIRDVRWMGLLKKGGIGAFHDYSDDFAGLKLAINIFLKINPDFAIERQVETLIFIRRKEVSSNNVMPAWIIACMTVISLIMQWKRSLHKRFFLKVS